MATTTTTPDTLDQDPEQEQEDLVDLVTAIADGENGDLSGLTPKQLEVIALLSQGQSVSAAACATKIHRTTIHHWRRTDPTFALALRDSERDTTQHWRCATQARAEKAFTALDGLLHNERTPATVRLKAILHVLNTATAIPAAAADPFEQDLLLAREQQMRKRQQAREIDQIMADDEAMHNPSIEEYQAPLYESEVNDDQQTLANASRNPIFHHNSSLSVKTTDCRTTLNAPAARHTASATPPRQAESAPKPAIHQHSSPSTDVGSCRINANLQQQPSRKAPTGFASSTILTKDSRTCPAPHNGTTRATRSYLLQQGRPAAQIDTPTCGRMTPSSQHSVRPKQLEEEPPKPCLA